MGFEELLGVNPWTALFTLANTVALFLVLKKYLFKPVLKMISDRQREIDDMYQKADSALDQAKTMETEYRQKLSDAQETGERIVKDAVARGQRREEDILRQAAQEADAMRAKATADIAREKTKAVNDAKNEISDMAMAIATKVVGRQLSGDDQSALIDGFIDELGDPS